MLRVLIAVFLVVALAGCGGSAEDAGENPATETYASPAAGVQPRTEFGATETAPPRQDADTRSRPIKDDQRIAEQGESSLSEEQAKKEKKKKNKKKKNTRLIVTEADIAECESLSPDAADVCFDAIEDGLARQGEQIMEDFYEDQLEYQEERAREACEGETHPLCDFYR